jgi:hypothetical protein
MTGKFGGGEVFAKEIFLSPRKAASVVVVK